MKLLQSLFILSLFCFIVSCGGGEQVSEDETTEEETSEESSDATETEDETSEETASLDLENEDVKMLVKTWKMISFTHEDGSNEEAQEEDLLVLNEDGTFADIFKGNEVATGVWSYDAEGRIISLKHKTGNLMGDNQKLAIKELAADKLITIDDDGKMTETFVVMTGEDAGAPDEAPEGEETSEE
ncbi:MAG: hypothetical protein AAFU64_07855 [Bacteroidota bacterium]